MKQKHTKYTRVNTNKSMHSEMGPLWQSPMQRTKNCSSKCSYDWAQLQCTIEQNSSDNLPSYLQGLMEHDHDAIYCVQQQDKVLFVDIQK